MKPGDRFSDARVRDIKLALMAGSDPVAIARFEGVSANTIRRIRDGETYNHVRVPGEDGMRKPRELGSYNPQGPAVVLKGMVEVNPMGKEEMDAMEQRLLAHQEEVNAKRATALPTAATPSTTDALAIFAKKARGEG